MTAIYRMTHDGWSGAQAFREMKQFNTAPIFSTLSSKISSTAIAPCSWPRVQRFPQRPSPERALTLLERAESHTGATPEHTGHRTMDHRRRMTTGTLMICREMVW